MGRWDANATSSVAIGDDDDDDDDARMARARDGGRAYVNGDIFIVHVRARVASRGRRACVGSPWRARHSIQGIGG